MKGLAIGPSTGWLYGIGVNSLARQRTVLGNAGADAVEFCMGTTFDRSDVRVGSLLRGDSFRHLSGGKWPLREYYRALHLPDYQPGVDSKSQAKTAREIAARQAVSTMLVHPSKCQGEYPFGYYEQLNLRTWSGVRIRLAIENMDSNKPDGFVLSELEHLVRSHDLAFVLDVQHAFEHDVSMAYAKDLFEAVRNSLAHLHVSGESEGSNHCLLHRARNAAEIVEFLGWIFSFARIPIILEGEYQNAGDLRTETEFITRELGLQR